MFGSHESLSSVQRNGCFFFAELQDSRVSDAEAACNRAGVGLRTRWHFASWRATQEVDSCSIECRAVGNHAVPPVHTQADDGGECRRSDGRVGSVGCDHLIGSSTLVDQCGVCGGDGRSCSKSLFGWRRTGDFSECSCGPTSHQVSIIVCINLATKRVVPQRLCAAAERPRPEIRPCPTAPCSARWTTGSWTACSCGAGRQHRPVFCVETPASIGRTEERRVEDQYCWKTPKPPAVRSCASECPKWAVGEFGACSTDCGRGTRKRTVDCRQNGRRLEASFCSSEAKPPAVQDCFADGGCFKARAHSNSSDVPFSSTSDTTYR
ncbi:Papilin [Aphelenchoides fujianensis]|nr:Papilin [Aphelenchoides fujianensis]